MMGADSWRLLRLRGDTPRLLVKTRFDDQGYSIELTDLGRVWGETLTKDQVIQRASDGDCSMDPTEDDQYQILLDKISSALNCTNGTELHLIPSDDGSEMSLDIAAELPGSLPTFRWYPQLDQLSNSIIRSELVDPLLLQAYHLQYNIQQLVDEIASKDRVIAKITDRLEASGNDLTTVFPGVSNVKTNRKRSQREQLAGHVQGLAEFDEKTWRASNMGVEGRQDLSNSALEVVLRDLPASERSTARLPRDDDWWRSHDTLDGGGEERGVDDSRQKKTPPPPSKRAATPSTVDEKSEPTFRERASATNMEADETTEDEDDLDAAPSRAASQDEVVSKQSEAESSSAAPTCPKPRRWGMLGGKPSNNPSAENAVESPTISQVESKSRTHTPDPPTSQVKSKTKSKLGVIGGKARLQTSGMDSSNNEPQDVSSPQPKSAVGGSDETPNASPQQKLSPPAKSAHKLGKFGGKKKHDNGDARLEQGQQKHTRPSTEATNEPAPSGQEGGARQNDTLSQEDEAQQERDGSEERADQKRERLKRELDQKAKAPVKKKRKF